MTKLRATIKNRRELQASRRSLRDFEYALTTVSPTVRQELETIAQVRAAA